MKQVDILMATYNGAKYIAAQIHSILGQRFQDWRLVIHDDGSTDATVEIVKKFASVDSRIVLIEDEIKFGNAAQNFLHLVRYAEAEYVMLADQDDIWFDNKVRIMFDEIKSKDKSIPQVVYTNSYVWKEKEGIKGLATLTFPKSLKEFLFLNSGMQGCVAIFNKAMCKNLERWQGKCAMHDHLLHLIGITFGEVTYIDLPLMLYRNHEANVTGETATKINDIGRVFKNNAIPVVDKKHYDAVKKFFLIYKDQIPSNKIKIINAYLKMAQKTLFGKFFDVFGFGFALFDSRFKLALKILIRPYIK